LAENLAQMDAEVQQLNALTPVQINRELIRVNVDRALRWLAFSICSCSACRRMTGVPLRK
jgi:hypothetical protein